MTGGSDRSKNRAPGSAKAAASSRGKGEAKAAASRGARGAKAKPATTKPASTRGFAPAAERAPMILERLRVSIPDAEIALAFGSPLELVVATILSAQCTDARVNIVTRDLFKTYRTPADYAGADPATLEKEIHSTGFFRNKAKSILGLAQALVERHAGEVPRTMEELTALPGVGRKTANVVLGNAYGIPGVIVDTHLIRVANRLALTREDDPVKIEHDMMGLFPQETWTEISHLITHHGRRVCNARAPRCPDCALVDLCPEGARRRSEARH